MQQKLYLLQIHQVQPLLQSWSSKTNGATQILFVMQVEAFQIQKKTLFHHRKEALAVMWACERCKPYLYGIDVELVSGHKPLEAIYGPR